MAKTKIYALPHFRNNFFFAWNHFSLSNLIVLTVNWFMHARRLESRTRHVAQLVRVRACRRKSFQRDSQQLRKKHIRSISRQTTFSRTRFFSRVRKTEATKMHFRKKLLLLFWMVSSSGKLPLLLNDLRPRAGRGRGKVWRGRSCWCWSTQTRLSPSQSWKVFKICNEAFIQPQSPAFLSMKL